MLRRRVLNGLVVTVLLAGLMSVLSPAAAKAQDSGTVVTTGLAYPRYLAVADDGNIYVSEAGLSGTEVVPATPGAPPQAPNGTPTVRGSTGKLTKIGPDGQKTSIAQGLPSYGAPGDVAGPAGVVYAGGYLWLVSGGEAIERGVAPLKYEGQLIRITPQTGEIKVIADIGAYEKANNPDKQDVNSNLYGMDLGADGNLYVADAGGNSLYKVNPTSGQLSLVTAFTNVKIPDNAPPPPGPPGRRDVQAVPTGVVGSTNGNVYVGYLTGAPFYPGLARVVNVSPDGKVSDQATGFTMVVGVEIGPDQNLYVTELTQGFGKTPADTKPGRVTRVKADGTKEVVADGLLLPNSVAFNKAGDMFVLTGTATPNGQLVRYNNVAPPPAASQPLPNTGTVEPGSVVFPQTGFALAGTFLSYWLGNGGLPVFGYPIDSDRQADGQIFQWMQRTRFELHPDNPAPYNVLLGRLGVEALSQKGIDWNSLPKVNSTPAGCQYFAATGHSLCGDFLNYWQANGLEFDGTTGKSYAESLALFGAPISEPKMELNSSGDTVLTQWFERARFELHPNNTPQYRVLLGLLGTEVSSFDASK